MFKRSNKTKAVLIFHPYSDIFSNASMLLLMEKLIEQDNQVHLYTYEKPDKLGSISEKIIYKKLPLFYPRAPRRPLLLLKATLIPLLYCLYDVIFKLNVKKYIGVDLDGLLTLSKIFPKRNHLFHYISFEIFFRDEIKDQHYLKLKNKEIKVLQKGVDSLLIQDKFRLELFLTENVNCKIKRTFFLPVAPSKRYAESAYLVDDLIVPIPENKKSVIYSGSLYKWSGILDILHEVENNWDSDYYLVIHNRDLGYGDSEIIKTIENYQKKGCQVILVHKELQNKDYYNFIKQFDAGLATYVAYTSDNHFDGKNFEVIGYSSGKFNTLMMMGIPTITTTNSSFTELKETYDFGYVLKDFSDLKAGLIYLKNNDDRIRKETRRLFNEVLDPELYIDDYIQQ